MKAKTTDDTRKIAIEFLHFVTQYDFTYVGLNSNVKPYIYTFLNNGYDPSSRFIPTEDKERLTSVELFDMFIENRNLLDKGFLFKDE